VLRNVIDTGSQADEMVNIVAVTNEVALPIINDLLSLDTTRTVARVFDLVKEIVSYRKQALCVKLTCSLLSLFLKLEKSSRRITDHLLKSSWSLLSAVSTQSLSDLRS
jgi:hypothetical protein